MFLQTPHMYVVGPFPLINGPSNPLPTKTDRVPSFGLGITLALTVGTLHDPYLLIIKFFP